MEMKTIAAKEQHDMIGVKNNDLENERLFQTTQHLEAQWFGNAGLGLFIHWGLSSVKGNMDLSWE